MWLDEIRLRLAARPAVDLPREAPGQRAAVLVPLYVDAGALSLLVTRRSDEVQHHKGQVSFPGGMEDDDDENLEATARREVYEEVGIEPRRVIVLGRLDEVLSTSGFRVTPFVGAIPYPDVWSPEPAEIAEIRTYSIGTLLEPGRREEKQLVFDGIKRAVVFYHVTPEPIWGLTARILDSFLAVLK